jgi:hypothetical protein
VASRCYDMILAHEVTSCSDVSIVGHACQRSRLVGDVTVPREIWVGIGLITEVLAWAPSALGPSERMVLIVIAEDARDATRESWALRREELGARAGLKPDALQKAFQRLAKAGLEVRVPLKVDKHGRPVYAYEGKKCTYRVPELKRAEQVPPSEPGTGTTLSDPEPGTDSTLADSEDGIGSTLSTQEDGTQSTLFSSEGGTDSPEGGTGSAPTPHNPSTTSSPPEKKRGAGGKARRGADTEHPRFAEWYAAYPLHKARGAAVKAFNNVMRDKEVDPDYLIEAANQYRADPQVLRGFAKYPATWLNQDCWLDEPAPLAATGTEGRQSRPGTNGASSGTGPLANVNDYWGDR